MQLWLLTTFDLFDVIMTSTNIKTKIWISFPINSTLLKNNLKSVLVYCSTKWYVSTFWRKIKREYFFLTSYLSIMKWCFLFEDRSVGLTNVFGVWLCLFADGIRYVTQWRRFFRLSEKTFKNPKNRSLFFPILFSV